MKPIDNDMNLTLRELAKSGFYGSVEIKLEAGRIVLIRITENYKPPMENPRYAGNERF
jgi:hypothetical protein